MIVINHTNGTWFKIENIRYVDFKNNQQDVIEIHHNKEVMIPKGYREHKPQIFSAELIHN